jgi:hypothetical protein
MRTPCGTGSSTTIRGVLISAVAYELVEEAFSTADAGSWVAAGLYAGPRRARSSRARKADALDGKVAEHNKNSLVLAVS